MQRGCFGIFKVKVTVWGNMKQYCFCCIFRTADPFAAKLSLMVHDHKPECLWKGCIALFKIKVTVIVKFH